VSSREEAVDTVVRRLVVSELPQRWMAERVNPSEAIMPRRADDVGILLSAYEGVCATCEYMPYTDETGREESSDDMRRGIAQSEETKRGIAQSEEKRRGIAQSVLTENKKETREGVIQGKDETCEPCDEEEKMIDESKRKEPKKRPAFPDHMRPIARNLQRKILGLIMSRIHEAQDFLSIECRADERGWITAPIKRIFSRISEALRPWVRAYIRLTTQRHLRQMNEVSSSWDDGKKLHPDAKVVYARFNLMTPDLYIGETGDIETRTTTHFLRTFKHSTQCTTRCKRCSEHQKYTRHNKCDPQRWLMLPIMECEDKRTAERMEKKLRGWWQPNLNMEKQPWERRDGYAKERSHRDNRVPPWCSRPRQREGRGTQMPSPLPPPFTTFLVGSQRCVDLEGLLWSHLGTAIQVKIQVGKHEFTKWSQVSRRYGETVVTIKNGNDEWHTTLASWRPHKTGATVLDITLTPIKATADLHEYYGMKAQDFAKTLKESNEGKLEFFWRVRNVLAQSKEFPTGARRMIWDEYERRWPTIPRQPIEIRLPFFTTIDPTKVRATLKEILKISGWPSCIVNWHQAHMKLVTASQRATTDIMCNVNQPWHDRSGCACHKVIQSMSKFRTYQPPMLNGHIFLIGREYTGPYSRVLNTNACNTPAPTEKDLHRSWMQAVKKFPAKKTEKEWTQLLNACRREGRTDNLFYTKDVYSLRKIMEGLVIGPLDKNNGELWACCPSLYNEALEASYTTEAGYQEIHVAKLSAYRKKRYQTCELPEQIIRGKPTPTNQRGTERDIVEMWRRIYKERGWERYASFNRKGGFNVPYVLFKAKNVTDPKIRQLKWRKVRPIAPGTKHPMRKILHLVGRAWSFLTARMPGEHFAINQSGDVPQFLRHVNAQLAKRGELRYVIQDIEGCYPNMPKEAIRFGLRNLVSNLKQQGHEEVYVPKYSDTQPCQWKSKRQNMVRLPFEVMMHVMEFALDNAIVKMPQGMLRKQIGGIPMGDPLSPGMTIGACAWMEKEWMANLSDQVKKNFMAMPPLVLNLMSPLPSQHQA